MSFERTFWRHHGRRVPGGAILFVEGLVDFLHPSLAAEGGMAGKWQAEGEDGPGREGLFYVFDTNVTYAYIPENDSL